ncbi:transporter substrate-binding domain-containing protein [Aeromicrobium sp. CFBP 8757]|uniref:transporter substrate-binding domain-containing protein n=1 Tax=Aeromicrobium sp. CFBP 8757 TaxID=2775288 RepID=UPI00177DB98F|nr:transporter substrate-binding domain-containing protein [Aeromicrobium sp. CFBP 8757]MBD8606819.1 transporter substrate-binding domain-containing protein [Aeromicrobium sp. CFBP 8757]
MASLRSSSARKAIVSLATAAVMTAVLGACGSGSDSDGGSASSGGSGSDQGVTVAGVSITKDDELAAMVPKDVADKGELTAIVYDNAPADTFVDEDGKITGWGPEFGEAVSALLGLTWAPEASGAFDTFIPSIQNGRYITGPWASLTVLPERLKVVDIVAVHENSTGVMTNEDSDLTISTPEDLCGLNVAALAGSSFISQLEEVSTTCTDAGKKAPTVKAYPQQAAAQLAVKNGRADAFATAKGQLAWLLRETKGFKLQPLDYQPALEGIGVSKTSGMTEPIAAAMDKLMEDGTYETILKKWDVDFGLLDKSQINPTS